MGKKKHGKGGSKGKSKGNNGPMGNLRAPTKKADSCSNGVEFKLSPVKRGSGCNDLPVSWLSSVC